MGSNTLTITHTALAELVLPVLPHASTEKYGPSVLECVQFHTAGGYLTAMATDRYTVAACRMPVAADVSFNALVPAQQVKALLVMFKPHRNMTGELTLTVTEHGTLQAEGPGALFGKATIEYALDHGQFPKVASIFAEMANATELDGGAVGLNPHLLAKFQHATRNAMPIQVRPTTPNRPVFVTCDDHFLGAIMPTRIVGGSEASTAGDWSAIFPTTVKGELAAAGK